jgi:hypothetical protein
MSISISASLPLTGKIGGLNVATPSDRETDGALAAQDAATETISQGRAPERGELERLLDQPSPLARFGG